MAAQRQCEKIGVGWVSTKPNETKPYTEKEPTALGAAISVLGRTAFAIVDGYS